MTSLKENITEAKPINHICLLLLLLTDRDVLFLGYFLTLDLGLSIIINYNSFISKEKNVLKLNLLDTKM